MHSNRWRNNWSERSPAARTDRLMAALVGGCALLLYIATLAPTVLPGDGGEFQFVPCLAGIAHPTGYPLYILLGWAWSHLLPLGDVAYRMNLFSAFWAALAVALLYPTVRLLLAQAVPHLAPGMNRLLSVLAALTFAVTPTLWSQATIAEVYGLHIFFVVLLLYLALRRGEQPDLRSPVPLAFSFGLALTHHRTTLLLAPALLVYLRLTARDKRLWPPATRRLFPTACYLLLAITLPLLLYLYIPLRAPQTPYLRLPLDADRELVLYENTWADFLDFVAGGPFGGSVDLTVDLGARLSMAWGLLRAEIPWPGLVLALTGLLGLLLYRRWAILALTGLAYTAVVAFNLVYTIGDIFVLFIPSYLIVVLWMALGAGMLADGLARWLGARLV